MSFCGGSFLGTRPSVIMRGGSSSPSRSGSLTSSGTLLPILVSFFGGRPLVRPGAFLKSTTFSAVRVCGSLFRSVKFHGTFVPLQMGLSGRKASCVIGRGNVPYYPRSSALPVGQRNDGSRLEDGLPAVGFMYPGVG